MLSSEELARYSRQTILPQFGVEGQEKLKSAKVLVIGAGGLGCPLLQYLTAAGVGTIGIADFDRVDVSNLHRQILYKEADSGRLKAEVAAERLSELNPFVKFVSHTDRITSANILSILADYNLVADGADNFPTRYLVNDACVLAGKPNVFASIFQFDGQVAVFNLRGADGRFSPNYRDLFPVPPPPDASPSCAESGVLGVLPGILGSLQALEVVKVITGIGEPLAGKLFTFDATTLETRILKYSPDPDNPLTGLNPTITELIDYEAFCGIKINNHKINLITVSELAVWRNEGRRFQLIDVREPDEYAIGNLGGDLIPLGRITEEVGKISREMPVVVHCKMGGRSARAIEKLQNEFGFDNLYNLSGGYTAYRSEIDTTLAPY